MTATETLTLTDFLLARIEDLESAWSEGVDLVTQQAFARFCSECGAWGEFGIEWPCPTLRALACIYADSPEWREEWADNARYAAPPR